MNIAIIPARIGSKRIVKKNIKLFNGSPMISFVIKESLKSGLFDKIIVSTDSDEIKKISEQYGATCPFTRPKNISDDFTPTVPVIDHAIRFCEENFNWNIDNVCCIYPCAPFLLKSDLEIGLKLLDGSTKDYVFPIAEFNSSIYRSLKIKEKNNLVSVFPENILERTQNLDKAYYDVGQFYWGRKSSWLKNDKIHSSSEGIIIPSWRAVDIDTPDDWKRAELLFNLLEKE